MSRPRGTLRTCKKRHTYYKRSDCPVCPICEKERAPQHGFMGVLAAPARRALEQAGIKSLKQLAAKRESEIASLHGMGPATLPKLKAALRNAGLSFKQ